MICWCDCIVCLVSLLVTWKKFSDFSVCLAIQSISVDQSYTASTYIQLYRAVVPHRSTTLTKVCVVVVDDVVFCVFFFQFYFSSIDSNFFPLLLLFDIAHCAWAVQHYRSRSYILVLFLTNYCCILHASIIICIVIHFCFCFFIFLFANENIVSREWLWSELYLCVLEKWYVPN